MAEMRSLTVVGGGLAGSEAAWQAAERGLRVILYEMRPGSNTPAHVTDRLAELVCSNSLGSNLPDRAPGLLKDELRRLGSLVVACADATAVPAGGALAVDREAFAALVTERVVAHPRIELRRQEVTSIPGEGLVIIATGPLTAPTLADQIATLTGSQHLYFYDAMAPIVSAESVDMSIAFRASRYGEAEEEGDYLNCPMNQEEYEHFVEALLAAETIPLANLSARTPASSKPACPSKSWPGAGRAPWPLARSSPWASPIRARAAGRMPWSSCDRTTRRPRCTTWWAFRPT